MCQYLPPPARVSRTTDLGDSVLTLTIVAAGLKQSFQLVEAGNLRKQESDRLTALATELRRCGVPVEEQPDGLTLGTAAVFRRARIQTYQDHRIAMSFAVMATRDAMGDGQPWLTIEDPECVNKTYPNFFETLESIARQSTTAAGQTHQPVVLTPNGVPVFA